MAKFETVSVTDAFDHAVKNATHLKVRDTALVMAARALARKIDAWDIIVDFAMEDAVERGERPKVPANDNVSIASFLKYLERLKLVPPDDAAGVGAGAASVPKSPADQMALMRQRLQQKKG